MNSTTYGSSTGGANSDRSTKRNLHPRRPAAWHGSCSIEPRPYGGACRAASDQMRAGSSLLAALQRLGRRFHLDWRMRRSCLTGIVLATGRQETLAMRAVPPCALSELV